jgi:hypothetical protein
MKKPANVGASVPAAASAQFLAEERQVAPTLVAYLKDSTWDDGASRETSTLMLLVEDGFLKVCLNDRAMGRSLWVATDSIWGAIEALEGHLAAGTGDWRVKKPFGSTGRKK